MWQVLTNGVHDERGGSILPIYVILSTNYGFTDLVHSLVVEVRIELIVTNRIRKGIYIS